MSPIGLYPSGIVPITTVLYSVSWESSRLPKIAEISGTTTVIGSINCGVITSAKIILYGVVTNMSGKVVLYRNDSYASIYSPAGDGITPLANTQVTLKTYHIEP